MSLEPVAGRGLQPALPPPPLSPAGRTEALARLAAEQFDVLVVGGGVTGAVGLAFLVCGVVAAAFAVGRVLASPVRPAQRGGGSGGAEVLPGRA